VSAAFKEARRQDYYLGQNPARDVAVTPTATAPKEGYAYSLDEIAAMLTVFPEPAKTVFAVAAFAGMRRGEIMGLLWENYRDGQLHVTRSIWGKNVNAPKTRKSAGAVPVIKQLAQRLDLYRLRCGNPQSGPMFANLNGNRRQSTTCFIARFFQHLMAAWSARSKRQSTSWLTTNTSGTIPFPRGAGFMPPAADSPAICTHSACRTSSSRTSFAIPMYR